MFVSCCLQPRKRSWLLAPDSKIRRVRFVACSIDESKIQVIARLGRPHGTSGWQVLQPFTVIPESAMAFECLYFRGPHIESWCLLDGHEFKVQAKHLLIKMPGVSQREAAAGFVGYELGADRDSFSALGQGEYYWIDLIGCYVETSDGAKLGRIESMIETGSSDVMEITGINKKHLIPFDNKYLSLVEVEERRIVVFWDERW